MADCPNLPDPDPVRLAALTAVEAMRTAQPYIALPPRRLDLEEAAADLERALREGAGT
jgi:hypothetical protein